jgi:hypothetical protein
MFKLLKNKNGCLQNLDVYRHYLVYRYNPDLDKFQVESTNMQSTQVQVVFNIRKNIYNQITEVSNSNDFVTIL